jgi:hypothetical protein
MIVEFQLTVERFSELVKQRIRASWPGYAGSIVW